MKRPAYTLIELIIAIIIAGIVLVSVANGYRMMTQALIKSHDLTRAIGLSETEYAIVNSLSYNDATLADGYNNLTANYQNSGYSLRRQVAYDQGTDATAQSLKRIIVTIYKGNTSTVILSTVCLRAKNVTYAP